MTGSIQKRQVLWMSVKKNHMILSEIMLLNIRVIIMIPLWLCCWMNLREDLNKLKKDYKWGTYL